MATKKIQLTVGPTTGDPAKGGVEEKAYSRPDRTPINTDLDIRDRLSELVGKGNVLNPDDKMAIYSYLTANLGKEKAGKLMNHAYIFNQRPDVQALPLEEKLKSFYTIGSNDKDVNDIISKSKSLGYGVLPGFRGSSSALNQVLAGRTTDVSGNTEAQPDLRNRVMLRVNK